MDFTKIERMDLLIRNNSTGRPIDFAKKLNMSERSLYNYINFMRIQLNAPIEYSNEMQSYFYTEPGVIYLGWHPSSKNNGMLWTDLQEFYEKAYRCRCWFFLQSI